MKTKTNKMYMYRCTRKTPYSLGTPGYTNPKARQGYYIKAKSVEEVLVIMQHKFPNDPAYSFDVILWSK